MCTFYPLLWGCYCCSAPSRVWLCDPQGPKHARFACPSPSPRVCPSSCPLNRWYRPTISSYVALFSCLQIFPSVRAFSNESALCIRWPKNWSFSFSIRPFNEYSRLFSLRLAGLISELSKGLSRVFSSTTVQKHQFFFAQPPLWSNSHICSWLLENPQPCLYGPLSAKWCLCFITPCLGLL